MGTAFRISGWVTLCKHLKGPLGLAGRRLRKNRRLMSRFPALPVEGLQGASGLLIFSHLVNSNISVLKCEEPICSLAVGSASGLKVEMKKSLS